MKQLTVKEWQGIFTQFCHDGFQFWKREGCSVAEAFDKARNETLNLKSYPYVPNGEPINKEAIQEWEKKYNQDVVNALYEYENNNNTKDLRVCSNCGFPVFDTNIGFYCCEKCAINS